MNRIALIVLALAAATASSTALAQDHGRDGHQQGKHHQGKHQGRHHRGIASLDANADGRISRAELADKGRRAGRLDKHFDAIDANLKTAMA